jgi:hypothetical protein
LQGKSLPQAGKATLTCLFPRFIVFFTTAIA